MDSQRDSFVFLKSYLEKCEMFQDAGQTDIELKLYRAIAKYGIYGEKSGDVMIDALLTEAFALIDKSAERREAKATAVKYKRREEMKLDEIAELKMQGMKQEEIAKKLGINQSTVSRRLLTIQSEYPELLKTQEERDKEFEVITGHKVFSVEGFENLGN